VSLLPSATEIVAALGGIEHLVGVTHACDWPPLVASRARVTMTAVDSTQTPGAIDAQVRDLAAAGTPLYTLKDRTIRDLRPDVILTQAICEVCAVHEDDVQRLAGTMVPAPTVVTLSATSLNAVFDDIARVGQAIDMAPEAEELLDGLRARLSFIHTTLKVARAPRPRVAVVEWGDPIFSGGHWVPDMIHRAGGLDVIGTPGARSRTLEVAELRRANPGIVVVAPCGYDLPRAAAEARRLLALDDWSWTAALPVWAIDANACASRPGPRLVDGVEILARIFNPDLFTPLDAAHAERIQ
jgi:iron complex transport system substrate-binding protein